MKSNERELIINLIKLFKEMYDIIVSNPNNDGNNEGAAKKALDGIVDFGIEIWNELVALFAE